MYGRIHDPGLGPYPLRVALALRIPGWGFHNVRGRIDPGVPVSPVCWSCRCMEGSLMRGWDLIPLPALRTPGWGFHTVRGDIEPGDHRFYPRLLKL